MRERERERESTRGIRIVIAPARTWLKRAEREGERLGPPGGVVVVVAEASTVNNGRRALKIGINYRDAGARIYAYL